MNEKKKIIYVGIRQSDSKYSPYIDDNCCVFVDDYQKNILRENQNKLDVNTIRNIERKLTKLIDKYEGNVSFIFYNNNWPYLMPESILNKTICINKKEILYKLNNKIICKNWLSNNNIPIVPFETISGQNVKNFNFNLNNEFVLQSNFGGGGLGTYIFNKSTFENIKNKIDLLKNYMLTPYLKYSYSVNVHVFISKSKNVISPGSIQICEIIDNQICYRGADFITFRNIDSSIKNRIYDLSCKIADLLKSIDYKGIAGIDYIVANDGNIYCAEINPRFQASSILIDKYLSTLNNEKSIFEISFDCFNDKVNTMLNYNSIINCSCYYYYKEKNSISNIKNKLNIFQHSNVEIDLDGLDFNKSKFNFDSYLFRGIFTHFICSISPDNLLWINDNIKLNNKINSLIELKIALLNQGVRIEHYDDSIKKGVYESIDIRLIDYKNKPCNIDMNCAYNINLSQYSPFTIDYKNNILYYYGNKIGNIDIEKNLLSNLSDISKKILYLATDRLRIKTISGCEFKNFNRGCSFCNVPSSKNSFSIEEIIQSLQELKATSVNFNHILIGGGTNLNYNSWNIIKEIASFLKSDDYYKNKKISLMSILPPTNELKLLKLSGIDEVAFNLEISNENLSAIYMPGKKYNKKYFYETMVKSIEIFGMNNVRSALIVGLDKIDDLYSEILKMSSLGILPCLSAFRALPNSILENQNHPTNEYLLNVYTNSLTMLKNSDLCIHDLGPVCKRCRNNMLHI